jgi:hypothetical protein
MKAYFFFIAICQYMHTILFLPNEGKMQAPVEEVLTKLLPQVQNGENVMSKLCAYLIFGLLNLLFCIASLLSVSRQLYYFLKALLTHQPCIYKQAPFLADFIGNA